MSKGVNKYSDLSGFHTKGRHINKDSSCDYKPSTNLTFSSHWVTGWGDCTTLLCITRGHLPKTASLHCLANLLSCSPTHSKTVCTAKSRGVAGICMWDASTVGLHYGWYRFSLIPTSSHIYIYSLGRHSAPSCARCLSSSLLGVMLWQLATRSKQEDTGVLSHPQE